MHRRDGWERPVFGHGRALLALAAASLVVTAGCAGAANQSRILAYRTGDGVWHRGGKDVTFPKAVELVPASFPPELRRTENLGQVLLEIEVSAEGQVVEAKVVRSVSPASDAEALRTVRQWKYQPARRGDQAVAVRKRACVTFQMKHDSKP
jgi:TonB family protein